MRKQGWESLLTSHIEEARRIQFRWGQNDCVLWCADWIEKATGDDLASEWRGTYETEKEANETLGDLGFFTPADLADHHLARTPVAHANRGDIVLHPLGILGINYGVQSFFLAESGVLRIKTLSCLLAWSVD